MRKTAHVVGRWIGGAGLALTLAGCVTATPVERAQRLVRLHREQEALAVLRQDVAAHPDDVPARRLYVRVLAFTGDLEGAKREAEALNRLRPNDPTAWIEMGHAYELTHHFDEALAAYDSAAEAAPANPEGPREGGMRAARWGEVEEAAPRLEEAIRRGARDVEVFHTLGLVRVHLKDFDGAKEAYRQGLAVDAKSTENLLGLATVEVARGDAAAALSAYDALARAKPQYAGAQLGRAWALAKLGRKAEAEQALVAATALGAPKANVDKLRAGMSTGEL